MSAGRPGKKALLAAGALAVMVAIVLAFAGGGSDGERPAYAREVVVYRMDADHATYPTVGGVNTDADAVLVGQVLSESTESGKSPGNDALGDPLPAIPHTNYTVNVSSAVKGGLTEGSNILVSMTGGTTPEGEFVLDGAPEISVGNTYLFFLQVSADGRYYPLAGGAAVASDRGDGTFELPADATGEESLVFTEAELQAKEPSSSPSPAPAPKPALTLTVRLAPHQRLAGALSKGLKLNVTCSVACRLGGQLKQVVKSRVAKRTRSVRKTVGAGQAGKSGALVLRFTRGSRTRLEEAKSVKLSLSVQATDPSGSVARLVRGVRLTRRSASLIP